jgi:hypothetical protein
LKWIPWRQVGEGVGVGVVALVRIDLEPDVDERFEHPEKQRRKPGINVKLLKIFVAKKIHHSVKFALL